jgi:hypothetical protein
MKIKRELKNNSSYSSTTRPSACHPYYAYHQLKITVEVFLNTMCIVLYIKRLMGARFLWLAQSVCSVHIQQQRRSLNITRMRL